MPHLASCLNRNQPAISSGDPDSLARFPIADADAFAAALAQKYNCPLVTGDPEFQRVDQLELDWIGSSEAPN
jgi:predicted nucleic acid-binding protein